ncbi:hypothetical protein [Sinimarinibacterium flocculans]|uniref:hypothetical protein n=1 Tax=Sinimarinibacterium flocculans TaxID=985250 RepID=UPI00351841F2
MRELIPPSPILFGNDFPFAPAPLTATQSETLDGSPLLDDGTRRAIYRTNAAGLSPRFAEAREAITSLPVFERETLRQRVSRAMRPPMVALTGQLRGR